MAFCALCFQPFTRTSPLDFCPSCEEGWQALRLSEQHRWIQPSGRSYVILSAYAYRGVCRDSILACKGRGYRLLGQALVKRSLALPEVLALAERCDVLMPAPSSLWSRWHGSLDLAAYLAEGLAIATGRMWRAPPWRLCFRWHKQALLPRHERRRVFQRDGIRYDAAYFYEVLPKVNPAERLKVLVIDDVVTTGHTLTELADRFANVDFTFYTLASAFRLSENTRQTLAL